MKNKIKKIAFVALAVMCVFIASCVSAFAAVSDHLDSDYKYFVVFDDNRYVVSFEPLYCEQRGDYYYFSSLSAYNFYSSDDTLFNSSDSACKYIISVSRSSSIKSSNYDIYCDNSLFFQETPLLIRLLNLLPQLTQTITGDMGTLTVCGVACLALLIGLSLLPKVLYKFL